MYATITTDGMLTYHDGIPNYDIIKEFIDGWFEVVTVGPGITMYLDEEDKLKGLPSNPIATSMAHLVEAIYPDDYIAGDVLLTRTDYRTGDSAPLNDAQVEFIDSVSDTFKKANAVA